MTSKTYLSAGKLEISKISKYGQQPESPVNPLDLEITEPKPKATKSETLATGPRNRCFKKSAVKILMQS